MKRDKNKQLAQHDSSSNEDNSTSSEDDENAELLTEELEEGFFKVLSRLKKKDADLYEGSLNFFTANNSEKDVKTKHKEGKIKKKSQKEFKKWLKGEKKEVENEEVKEDLKALHDFWTNPKLNKDEQFLRDYILNQKFLDPDENFHIEEEVNKLSDEEKEVEEELIFEHKYNCRFENQDKDAVDKSLTKKGEYEKSLKKKKRKRRDSIQHNTVKTSNIGSENVTDAKSNLPSKKLKTKANFNCDTSEKKKKIILSTDEHKPILNLPRNLQMKNEKTKSKMRHRNRKKNLLETNRALVQVAEKNKDGVSHHLAKTKQKGMKKIQRRYKKHDEFVKKKMKTKKNKHFQNLIVKEKKDKMLKFSKIKSKKQKAANTVHK